MRKRKPYRCEVMHLYAQLGITWPFARLPQGVQAKAAWRGYGRA